MSGNEIKILKENLEENKKELDDYKNKIVKLGEEHILALDQLSKIKEDFEKLENENGTVFEEKARLLKELDQYKIKMIKMEEENKKLTKKLKDSENIISQLRHEISQNKRNYEQAIKQVKDLTKEQAEQIKILTERNAAYSDAKYEAEKKAKELLTKIEQLQVENKEFVTNIQLKNAKIRSFEMKVKEWQSANDSLNIKIVELTKELGRLNKDAQIFYVNRPNKMCTIKNENSCCENKCINSNLFDGYCIKGNGFVNVYEDYCRGVINYCDKRQDGTVKDNKWICLYGQHPYSKASGYGSDCTLFYFEVKISKELNSKM
uniref:Uncharacterized protein n=1 Tax=Meloidogyne incognita TaxID=6306 RepID=A0A914N488_MELIC